VNWFEKDNNSNYADAGMRHVDPADVVDVANERFEAWRCSTFFLISWQEADTSSRRARREQMAKTLKSCSIIC
jgi:hypothetical protein